MKKRITRNGAAAVEELHLCPCCDSTRLVQLCAPPVGIGVEHFARVKDQLGMSKCGECQLAFINPRPAERMLIEFYNQDGYDCHNYDFEVGIADSGERARLELIERVGGKGAILDFGAGAGHLLRAALLRKWPRVFGVELGAVARAKLQREGLTVYASLQDVPARVEVVTMVHVLEHLVDPGAILRQIRESVLKSGGIFFVEVPNADSLRARLALSPLRRLWTLNAQRYCAFPIHLLYFNPRSLVRFLEHQGFQVLTLGTMGLGVEELRAAPPKPQAKVSSPPALQNSRLPASLKGAIKSTMSWLRLGENLYAVCRSR